jgi:branched-chain amino acid transport system ATP-binding protein
LSGQTTTFAEQNMHFCLGIASDARVIGKGQIVYRDTIAGLKANDEIRSRYLAIDRAFSYNRSSRPTISA